MNMCVTKSNSGNSDRSVAKNRNKAKVLSGLLMAQVAILPTICEAGTVLLGDGATLNPWATNGDVTVPTPTPAGLGLTVFNTDPHSGQVGAWDIKTSGVTAVSLLGLGVTSSAAQVKVENNQLVFTSDNNGLLGNLGVAELTMNWNANLDLGTGFTANSKYDISFDLDLDPGLTTLSLFGDFDFRVVDENGTVISTLAGGEILNLLDILGTDNSGTVNWSFTTGDTVPVGDIHLEFSGSKLANAANLFGSDYMRLSNLNMEFNPVPEPTSLVLLGLGTLALLRRRR